MFGILRAYARAATSLTRPSVLAHFLWPVLLSAAGWITLGVLYWDRLARALVGLARHHLPLTAAAREATEVALAASLKVALYLVSIPLALATALLLVELVALPFILDRVARTDYPRLEARHGGTQWQSLRNTLVSFAVAAAVAIASLPLWLVPGVGVIVSLALSSWLNYRSFRYDVLMKHADPRELYALPTAYRGRLLVLSFGAATLTLVPVLNLLAVPFAGLAFTHYLLTALERSRAGAGGPPGRS
jgi:CysZ protein